MARARARQKQQAAIPPVPLLPRISPRTWLGLALLALALILGTWSRVVQVSSVDFLDADATIAYLQSAGHAGQDWSNAVAGPERLTDRWVQAREWKRLLEADFPPPLARIWRDQSTDVHPPLYYVLLGTWRAWFGQGMRTGIAFNIPVAAMTMLAVFGLVLMATKDSLHAALAAGFFAAMPAALTGVTTAAKMYELLALWTVLLAIAVLVYVRGKRRHEYLAAGGLALLSVLGMLTHVLFALSLVLAVVWLVVGVLTQRDSTGRVRRLGLALGAVVFGVAIAAVIYPSLLQGPARTLTMGGQYTLGTPSGSASARAEWLRSLIGDGILGAQAAGWVFSTITAGIGLVLISLVIGSALAVYVASSRDDHPGTAFSIEQLQSTAGSSWPLVLAVGSAAVVPIVLLGWGYMTSRMPYLSARYLAQAMPFVAAGLVLAVRAIRRPAASAVMAAYVMLLLAASLLSCLPGMFPQPTVVPAEELADATNLVVDTGDLSYLPKVLVLIPDDTMVYVSSSQDDLASSRSVWEPAIGPGTHYVSFPIRENTVEGGSAIATEMGGGRGVDSIVLSPYGEMLSPDMATLWVVR